MFGCALLWIGRKEPCIERNSPFLLQMEPEDFLLCREEHTALLFREPDNPLQMFIRRHFEVYFIILSATILWFVVKTV